MNKLEQRRAALKLIRFDMRRYARDRRGNDFFSSSHGIVLGSLYMADRVQAITPADFDRLEKRLTRIRDAKVSRPFRRLQVVSVA